MIKIVCHDECSEVIKTQYLFLKAFRLTPSSVKKRKKFYIQIQI